MKSKFAQPTYITQQIFGVYHPADGAKISNFIK